MIDGFHIERALALTPGESLILEEYGIHRYSDGWTVLWAFPKPGNLGMFFCGPASLSAFLKNGSALGQTIANPGNPWI